MTVPNIITVVGSGGALLVAGSLMLGTSAALGLSAAVPTVPIWATFLLFGLIFTTGGILLVVRGGEKTTEQVEKVEEQISVVGAAKHLPLVALAGGALFGFVISKLFQSGGRTREVQVLVEPTTSSVPGETPVAAPVVQRVVKQPTFFDSVLERLVPLAAMAVSTAAGVGMKTLGIPEPADLIAELLGMPKEPASERAYRPAESGRHHNGRS